MSILRQAFRTIRSTVRLREFERDGVARRLRSAANVDDLRKIAKRRLPGGVFDYIDGGAQDEWTLRENVADYSRIGFRPRVLRDVGGVDTSTELFGRSLPFPVVLAPTGFTRIANSLGEIAVARAAAVAGIPYSLSTLSTRSIEEVASVGHPRLWFQVYVWKDRGLVAEMLARAAEAGYEAIIVTVDTPVLGRRERDVRRGFTLPPKLGASTLLDGIMHPGWTFDFLRGGPISFANVAGVHVGDGTDVVSLSAYVNEQFDPALSWDDLEWFRERWDGPILLKGVQTLADAQMAADAGVDAVVLSNHGGRQLDGAPTPVSLVGPVVQEVGDRVEVICDGGVRRGADVIKAVALGASAVMVGRPYLYGLGAGGEAGVGKVLDLLHEGIVRTMSLIGCADIASLGEEYLDLASVAEFSRAR